MHDIPLVSVVVPTHNRPGLLKEALESLQRQTLLRWEAIVVDDASAPPATIGELPRAAERQVKLVRHATAKGGAAAKNTGIEHANAPLIAFLDDDDLYAPEYLAKAVDVLERHQEIDVLFMGVSWFGADADWGERTYQTAMRKVLAEAEGAVTEGNLVAFDRRLIKALLKSVPMAFQRPIVRAATLGDIGGYEPNCLLWDCDWALRAAIRGKVALLHEGLYRQRIDGQGWSSKNSREFDHLKSGLEFLDRLLDGCPKSDLWLRAQLTQAAADGRFNLAHYYVRTGHHGNALAAWMDSLRRKFVPRRLKFVARIAFSALFGGPRSNEP